MSASEAEQSGYVFQEGTMVESTRLTQPVEKPSRLQLAIREWQRQLVENANTTHSLFHQRGAEHAEDC